MHTETPLWFVILWTIPYALALLVLVYETINCASKVVFLSRISTVERSLKLGYTRGHYFLFLVANLSIWYMIFTLAFGTSPVML